ncbi:hypothetical protein C8J57DRAFT_1311939 [Mycena rebaudengoi]|nr:hypothetical protein C8J57DRAFT_1311939 [Mycena rebaudengoi]
MLSFRNLNSLSIFILSSLLCAMFSTFAACGLCTHTHPLADLCLLGEPCLNILYAYMCSLVATTLPLRPNFGSYLRNTTQRKRKKPKKPTQSKRYRLALSDTHQWDEKDGNFDYLRFSYNVVQWFEAPPGPIAQREVDRLLDWWNTNVFGSPTQWGLYDSEAGPATSSVARTIARRAAHELGA